ncbi:MAG: T9SS type A sorting domain-containing protein [Bacteroidales bacterium]|nr:T9SS type A sorting domain-containing protein [Bacteroidales bacterium]
MKNKLTFISFIVTFFFYGVSAQTFYSCDQWATFSNNGYNVYNNIWGSGAGTQCLSANAYNNWSVTANHPTTGGIKSYPNVSKELSINLSQLSSCVSSFSVTRPGSGSYSSTYDIWCNNHAYEIMIWMNYTGAVGPIAESWDASGNPVANATNQSIGGHTFNVYRGSNGSNVVYSFLRTSNTNSGTVDIKAILDWIRNRGWFGDVNLHKIEFGFEITSAPNVTFSVTNYSLSYSQGSSCIPTSITPYLQINGGSWQQTSSASLSVGNTIKFGPQPVSGGSWRWSGPNNYSSTSREITISNIQTSQAGTYTATYTNSCGAQSSRAFTVTVSGGSSCTPTSITPYLQINGGSWQQTSSASLSVGNSIKFGPQPVSGGSWRWSGPNSYSSTSREITISNIQASQAGTYTATYTNSCGAQSSQAFSITVGGGSSGSTVTVRARGTQGGEQIQLKLSGTTVGTWTLTTSYANYSASGTGTVEVHFINDNGPRDVQTDYAIINGTTYQSENESANTGVYANGRCGGGTYSEWLHCNGYIRWSATAKSTNFKGIPSEFTYYPNPVTEGLLSIDLGDLMSQAKIEILDLSGRIISAYRYYDCQLIEIQTELNPGIYLLKVSIDGISHVKKLLVE